MVDLTTTCHLSSIFAVQIPVLFVLLIPSTTPQGNRVLLLLFFQRGLTIKSSKLPKAKHWLSDKAKF